MTTLRAFLACGFLAVAATGCASKPAIPFDSMPTSQVTAYRLQNYEPPSAQTGTGGAVQLPPQIQQWVQMGSQVAKDYGLGGIIPGLGGAAGGGQAAEAPRFPAGMPKEQSFRINLSKPVMDEQIKQELADIFGHADNFGPQRGNCMYAELGISWAPNPGAPPMNLLVSFSCNEVRASGFAWPHPEYGLKPDTLKRLQPVVHKIWTN